MGRASSAKKVQRVARASGRSKSTKNRKNLLFPSVVATVVVLGLALVVFARNAEEASADAPALGDHWHAAVGVYTCDAFSEPLVDQNGDANGIHTHGDNVIHIHPTTSNATGDDATLGVWAEEVGIEFTDDGFTLPNGDSFSEGDDCGGQPGKVRVVAWDSAADVEAGRTVYDSDFADVRFEQDGMAFTIAFVAEDADVLPPPTAPNLAELGAIDSGGAPADPSATVPGGDPSATIPIDPSALEEGTEIPVPGSEEQPSTTAAG